MKCFKCGLEIKDGIDVCPKCNEFQGFSDELINKAKLGDQQAMGELYKRTYNNVYLTIKTMVKSEDTVLDILQDSYVKGFKKLSQLQDPNKFRAWIKTIAHNTTVDYLRKTKPIMFSTMSTDDEEIIDFEDNRLGNIPEIVVDQKETARLINEILETLNDEQRLVISMFYYQQMSIKEIAQIIDVSENTVKSRLSYGRKRIELKVKELEKSGTKLYSLAPLPFLLLLFKNMDIQASELPSISIFQNIIEKCDVIGNIDGANPEDVISLSEKMGTTVAKSSLSSISKGVVTKIIAGICAVAIIGGVATGITLYKNNKDEQRKLKQQQETVQESIENKTEADKEKTNEEKINIQEIYLPILDEYRQAMLKRSFEEGEFPNISEVMMQVYYYQEGGLKDGIYTGFYYTYYDVDNNGIDELIISYGSEEKYICDIYGINNNTPKKLIDEYTLGERSQLSIYPDGTIVMISSGGYDLTGVNIYHFSEKGDELVDSGFETTNENTENYISEKTNNQQKVENFDWKPIDTNWNNESTQTTDLKEYISVYSNGQDWNSGVLTIEENDIESVKVKLEGFRTRSDTALSTIFEGIGYYDNNSIVVDVYGEQVKIKEGNLGLILEVPETLKSQWNLDSYIYDNEYLNTMG